MMFPLCSVDIVKATEFYFRKMKLWKRRKLEPEPAVTPAPTATTAPAQGTQTGDSNSLLLWSLLGMMSLGGVCMVRHEKKKN